MLSSVKLYLVARTDKLSNRQLILFTLSLIAGLACYQLDFELPRLETNKFSYLVVLVTIIALLSQFFLPEGRKTLPNRYKIPLILIGSSFLSYFLFGVNLQAKFGIIDDYQIAHYVGDGRLSLIEIPKYLAETEIIKPGRFPRYRPSYYILRVSEAFLWGRDPFTWYLARILIASSFAGIIWFLLQNWIGLLPAGLLVLYIFTFSTWADIFARLGASETYGSLGISLFLLGLYLLLHKTRIDREVKLRYIGWFLITLGAFIAMGVKENFLILATPPIVMFFVALKKRQNWLVALISTILTTSFAVFIAWAIISALADYGTTIRGESIGLSGRIEVLLMAMREPVALLMVITIPILLAIWVFSKYVTRNENLQHIAFAALTAMCSCYVLYLSQFFFYNGDWPKGNRYDFPGIFYKPFFFLTLAWFFINFLKVYKTERAVYLGLQTGFTIGLALLILQTGFAAIIEQGTRNVRTTQAFDARLTQVVNVMRQSPTSAIVIESYNIGNYESVYGWERYLRAYGVTNPIFLRIHSYSSDTATSIHDRVLASGLENTSQNGRYDQGRNFSPISQFDGFVHNCFSLHLTGKTETECTDLLP